jgi:predicted kinase
MPSWAVLVILAGLPATGKTTIGRALGRSLGAVHVRVDTIEQAIVRSGAAAHPVGVVGYAVAYAVAEDHLRQGHTVIAESVNPLPVTRSAWRDVARGVGTPYLEVEVVCGDPVEHERRATTRTVDIPDLPLPTWDDIQHREYAPWDGDHLVLDTARHTVAECVAQVRSVLSAAPAQGGERTAGDE